MGAARDGRLPPGPVYPRALQRLGWATRHGPFMERCRARYGDTFTLRTEKGVDYVVVSDPAAVEQVFRGDPKVFHAGEANLPLRPLLGPTSVFQLDEDEHMRLRKLMLPPFHGQRMRNFGDLIRRLTAEDLERWPVGEPMAVRPPLEAVTLDVIMHVVFGIAEGERFDLLRDLLVRRAVARADPLLFEEIRTRRSDPGVGERDDIMSMLLEARYEDGSGLSDQQVRDQLVTLLIAGHETTNTALAWALERLVRHPDKLERLRRELAEGDDTYLDAVLKETLRIRTVIAAIARTLTEPAEIAGHELPAGATVMPSIHLLHRHPDVYPEPRRFLPERFLDRPAGTYTWIPFGGGTRRCLGATFALFEMKEIMSVIVLGAGLRAARPESETSIHRSASHRPSRGGEVVVEWKAAQDSRAVGSPGRARAASTPRRAPSRSPLSPRSLARGLPRPVKRRLRRARRRLDMARS